MHINVTIVNNQVVYYELNLVIFRLFSKNILSSQSFSEQFKNVKRFVSEHVKYTHESVDLDCPRAICGLVRKLEDHVQEITWQNKI